MARAYIAVDWLEDTSIGLSGGSANIPFIIEIDAAGDDPYVPWLAACPFNSSFRELAEVPVAIARRFVGLVSIEYGNLRLLNEKTYRGIVTYGPVSDRTIGLWRRSVRFASETRPLVWSLPELNQNGQFTPGGKPKRVGTREYVAVDSTVNTTYSVDDGLGTKVKRTGWLDDANISINSGITSIVYEILVPQLTSEKVRSLSDLKWHTNASSWLGYKRWTLIFANFEVHDEVVTLPGSRPNVQWYSNVVIEVLHRALDDDANPFGWRAFNIYDVFKRTSDGKVIAVQDSSIGGDQPFETYVQYHEVDFSSLFSITGYAGPFI